MSSNIRVNRVCKQCGEVFIAKTTVTQFCGDRCSKRAYKARKKREKLEKSQQETIEVIQKPLTEIQQKEYLSVKETCLMFPISRTTLWRMIRREQLKVARMGSRVVIRKEELNRLFT
jgi:excisionase family DNA binding protein